MAIAGEPGGARKADRCNVRSNTGVEEASCNREGIIALWSVCQMQGTEAHSFLQ